MVVFAASSWRSTYYMVEAVRGVLDPVRIATWCKPGATSKTRTPGWRWSSVNVIALRKGKAAELPPSDLPDFIVEAALRIGRRAQLPESVALWAVAPFVVVGGAMLDPFAGSGTLVKAAENCGMNAVGIEIANDPSRAVQGLPHTS
ncbi:MAG: DNA methyltransferase [Pyrinomonadaceae bacterium]